MNKKKFEQEFRNAFLGNEQAPIDGFKYYEDKLGLERKQPLYKRRPFFVNAMMVCVFLIVVVATNLTTYFVKKDQYYFDNIEEELEENLIEKYSIFIQDKIFQSKIHNSNFELYILTGEDSKKYFLIIYKDFENVRVELTINDSSQKIKFNNILSTSDNDRFYYISDAIVEDITKVFFLVKEIETENILVKYYF